MSFHQSLQNKIVTREKALDLLNNFRKEGKRIVFTNGCFDLLHPGHVDYLSQARDKGDLLVLGLNTDDSVRRLQKSPERPINNEKARALVLAGLAPVDLIVLFNEDTPETLIRFLKPDVLVKGDDYTVDKIAGASFVLEQGGEVLTIPLLQGYSTSKIVSRIKS